MKPLDVLIFTIISSSLHVKNFLTFYIADLQNIFHRSGANCSILGAKFLM